MFRREHDVNPMVVDEAVSLYSGAPDQARGRELTEPTSTYERAAILSVGAPAAPSGLFRWGIPTQGSASLHPGLYSGRRFAAEEFAVVSDKVLDVENASGSIREG